MDVIESPEIPGLPAVEGTIAVTVHGVSDPLLPELPTPAPRPTPGNAPKLEIQKEALRPAFVSISAMVYDNKRTLLRCSLMNGKHRELVAWSNLDFRHFAGLGTFSAKSGDGAQRAYHLFLCAYGVDTVKTRERMEARGLQYVQPQIPVLPDGAPAFVLENQEIDSQEMTLLEDLHALYRDEGPRMAAALVAREKVYEERKAFLLANPPQPQDVKVHFWKRESQVEESAVVELQGGQP